MVALLVSGSLPPAALATDPTPVPWPIGGSSPVVSAQSFTGYVIVLPRAGTVIAETLAAEQGWEIADFGVVDPPNRQLIADAGHRPGVVATVGTYGAGAGLTFYITTRVVPATYLSTGGNAHIVQEGPESWTIG